MDDKTCREWKDDWGHNLCGKPVFEVIDGNPLCKAHAKKYRVKQGMDTGETLETRYFVDLSCRAIFELHGIAASKVFTVRKSQERFGSGLFFSARIDIKNGQLHDTLEAAIKYLIARNEASIIDAREKIEALEKMNCKLEKELP